MATLKALAFSMCLLAAGAVKITAISLGNCNLAGFHMMKCDGTAMMAAKYPNDDFTDAAMSLEDCENIFAPNNASSHKIVIMVGFGYGACGLKSAAAAPNTWIVVI